MGSMSALASFINYDASEVTCYLFDSRDVVDKGFDAFRRDEIETDVEIERGLHFHIEDTRLVCICKLDVTWNVLYRAKEGDESGKVRTQCCIAGAASCESDLDERATLENVLAQNVIVFLWGKIRDLIEASSLMSPIGKLTLPAINPAVLLEKGMEVES